MKKLLWLILWIICTIAACTLWFVIIGFIGVGVTIAITRITQSPSLYDNLNENLWGTIILIGWSVLIVLSVILWRRWKFRCSACKRWAALVLAKTDLIKQDKISVRMEMEHRDWQGNVTGYHDQYIPGKRKTYKDTYKCKHCGSLETYTRTTRSANL
ncbi:hypothetical protein LJC32_02190 [Oscillospiraceae bacterium OttesenSCG-928-F05]|nr:hypothetical protein [Oscillospiraceae bacterium OttesenSCG-928-F05]